MTLSRIKKKVTLSCEKKGKKKNEGHVLLFINVSCGAPKLGHDNAWEQEEKGDKNIN